MSEIALQEVKDFLDVIHDSDDAKLQVLTDAAEDEALKFMNRTQFGELCEENSNWDSTVDYGIPDSVKVAVFLLVQGKYDAAADQIDVFRKAAESILMPYRCNMGM